MERYGLKCSDPVWMRVLVLVVLIALCILIAGLYFGIIGFLVMIAWNGVAPVFWSEAPRLNWLQGAALVFLVSIMTGGSIRYNKSKD